MHLKRVLLIANPTSQNGKGAQAAKVAFELLQQRLGAECVEMRLTGGPDHARTMAQEAQGFTTVLALGGDGVIHETVNGLMSRPVEDRPAFGLIPVGSGNDYARSVGASTKVEAAVEQILSAPIQAVDMGFCNGQYFTETVSFGLDAAIAIDTMERRKRTGRTGTILYLEAGFDQMFRNLRKYRCRMSCDGSPFSEQEVYLLAVQNGRTYGGGFAVCPDASITDGIFDLCWAVPKLSPLFAAVVFLSAKEGHHRGFKQVHSSRAQSVVVEFDDPVPAQIDGEKLEGTRFEITMTPRALNVIMPAAKA